MSSIDSVLKANGSLLTSMVLFNLLVCTENAFEDQLDKIAIALKAYLTSFNSLESKLDQNQTQLREMIGPLR